MKSKLKTALVMIVVAGSLAFGIAEAAGIGLPTEGPCYYKAGCKFGGNVNGCCQAW